jgi:hypothetical protein
MDDRVPSAASLPLACCSRRLFNLRNGYETNFSFLLCSLAIATSAQAAVIIAQTGQTGQTGQTFNFTNDI